MPVKNRKPMSEKTQKFLSYSFNILYLMTGGIMLVMSTVTDSRPLILFWWGLFACMIYFSYLWSKHYLVCKPHIVIRFAAAILPALLVYLLARH